MNATESTPARQHDENTDLLATLCITRIDRRAQRRLAGCWVSGRIAGHEFEALVFPEHAESEAFELGDSRISKLWLRETATRITAANFDRGWDIQPTTDLARRLVDLLAAGLVETVFGR